MQGIGLGERRRSVAHPPARSRARGILVGLVGAAGFSVVREVDGLRQGPLGVLYGPQYLVGDIAIHGSGSIPAVPASHGWAR